MTSFRWRDCSWLLTRSSSHHISFYYSRSCPYCYHLQWLTYGILTRDFFVFFGNAAGFLMSIWLNMQAVKLQYESFRAQEMEKAILAALADARETIARTPASNAQQVVEEQAQHLLEAATHAGDCTPEPANIHSLSEAARIVVGVTSQNMVAPAPHERLVLANVVVWLAIISIIGFGAALTDRTKQLIVGVTVNLNLVIFYGSPLSVIWTVVRSRSAATIHVPTMVTNTLNGTFWAAYGIAVLDPFIAVPNAVGAGLGVIQIALCALFPRNKIPESAAKNDDDPKKVSMDEEAQPIKVASESKRGA